MVLSNPEQSVRHKWFINQWTIQWLPTRCTGVEPTGAQGGETKKGRLLYWNTIWQKISEQTYRTKWSANKVAFTNSTLVYQGPAHTYSVLWVNGVSSFNTVLVIPTDHRISALHARPFHAWDPLRSFRDRSCVSCLTSSGMSIVSQQCLHQVGLGTYAWEAYWKCTASPTRHIWLSLLLSSSSTLEFYRSSLWRFAIAVIK